MRGSQTKVIDGLGFTVQQLPAMRSVKLMHRLARTLGPALLKSLSGVKGATGAGVKLADVDVGAMADGAQILFDRFSENDLEALIRELLETAMVQENGNTMPVMQAFDVVFTGRPGTVLKAVQFALEVNYHDFFTTLLGAVRGLGIQSMPAQS